MTEIEPKIKQPISQTHLVLWGFFMLTLAKMHKLFFPVNNSNHHGQHIFVYFIMLLAHWYCRCSRGWIARVNSQSTRADISQSWSDELCSFPLQAAHTASWKSDRFHIQRRGQTDSPERKPMFLPGSCRSSRNVYTAPKIICHKSVLEILISLSRWSLLWFKLQGFITFYFADEKKSLKVG